VDIGTILEELREQRDQIMDAIMSLERLQSGHHKRRGRPPAWMVAAKQTMPAKRRRRPPVSQNAQKKS
jgi:hypothetical protein